MLYELKCPGDAFDIVGKQRTESQRELYDASALLDTKQVVAIRSSANWSCILYILNWHWTAGDNTVYLLVIGFYRL